ncbi:unnamed protein product [Porites lobata]|uniref:GIY-YIG domain-containing protein n=1 Tax=Porites lobata TaxID=104759 RepID=A0ABN8QEX7_9CNID|nr:unnamed protein product [Porites lobata]
MQRQLNDAKFYRQLDGDITDTIQQRVTVYIERMFDDGYIDEKTKKYLVQTNVKPGRFYIRPKIHKTGNPGRPIVSSNSHPTERISQFVDYYINPLVSTLDSHIKDTTDFLNTLSHLGNLPNNAILVTLDVSSLYTNIPHNQGIDACRHFLDTRPNKHIPTETLCDLLRMILTMNNFTFNQQHYLQIHGTAMGTKMAPSFANLFLGIRSSNLRDLLVKAQLPVISTNHFPPGFFRCGQNCATCPYITNGLTSYTFYATGETRSITSHITCNTKNISNRLPNRYFPENCRWVPLIYMVQCNCCNLQYIGETKRRLKDRFNEHRRAVDKTNIKSKPTTVSEHFLSHSNHSHTDMQLIPLEKIHSSRDSVRKARESHLIDKAMTLEPHGLNRRDELL